LSTPAMAADEPAVSAGSEISVNEIALELSNPVTALRSLAIDIEYRTYQGDLPESDDQSASRFVFTPSWPFKLSNGKNILLSVDIPINGDQPLWRPGRFKEYPEFLIRQLPDEAFARGAFFSGHGHLDDIGFNIGYGGVNEKGLITMFGLASVFPTSTDTNNSRDQYLLGPEFALGKVTRWGLIGAQASHLTRISGEDQWDTIAGEHKLDTNLSSVKIFFAYGLSNGWQIESNPTIFYDWEAVSGNEWAVPIGAGISKTVRLGGVPLKMGFEIESFVVSPDRFGPDWQLRVSFTPVLSTRLLR